MLLQVNHLEVRFPQAHGEIGAVRDVSLALAAGEVLGLVGESGSGKSVTALALMGLLPPEAQVWGEIHFEQRDLRAASAGEMRRLRGASMAMIFQEPMTALNPVMRIGAQIAEGVRAHEKVSRRAAWSRAVEALKDVAIHDPEARARDYPHQLSGGMRQRAMIAMAIVNRPQLLIADEPTTALDVTIQAQILQLLAELRQRLGLAMLFISHDLTVVRQVAGRLAVMYAGSVVEMGSCDDVFLRPGHPYTRGLLRAVPTLTSSRGEPLVTMEGTVPAAGQPLPGCAFAPRCSWQRPACAQALPPLVETSAGHLVRCPVVAQEPE